MIPAANGFASHALMAIFLSTVLAVGLVDAKAPVLQSHPAYASPVYADGDDLLLLAGYGLSATDTVVYVADSDVAPPVEPPSSVPGQSTAVSGVASVVSVLNIPFSLTVRLPEVVHKEQSYSLWVRGTGDEWSNAVRINDPRPLWITPGFAYATHAVASLPRELKIVGRNLQSHPQVPVLVRILGPQTHQLSASTPEPSRSQGQSYVITVKLPPRIEPGNYAVLISRGGRRWVLLPDQKLHVLPDPGEPATIRIANPEYGGCRPDDSKDDARCLRAALQAAARHGGSHVVLDAGTWEMGTSDSIIIPHGVGLLGQRSGTTRIMTHSNAAPTASAAFILMGKNLVRDLTFADRAYYSPERKPAAMLQLGPDWSRTRNAAVQDERSVDDVVITRNVFDRPGYAISDAGLPIRRLFVTYNEVGAYRVGLQLGGSRFNVGRRFRIDDSVISNNYFAPGSYLDLPQGQGAMASEIGASFRLDFSNNTADGASSRYSYSKSDAQGWRAAFFWHLNDSQEMLLVAQNTATCTGDKAGDGEAIAYDNNANTFAFERAQDVVSATHESVTVHGLLEDRQQGKPVRLPSYYEGHWIQIADGAGVGQTRRISSYSRDSQNARVTFRITPAWDVEPDPHTSRITVSRQFWQVYTLNNTIDHRRPLCQKSNRTRKKGGGIVLWAQTADSVVSGNRQFDSDGITFHEFYGAPGPKCKECVTQVSAHSFVDINNNIIDGEYDWESDCSWSGIQGSNGAAPTSPPPIIGYGLSISHNQIIHADGLRGGAIAFPLTWHAGPPPHRWPLTNNALVFHNSIQDISGRPATSKCAKRRFDRVGINLADADTVWRTVLYANSCTGVARPLGVGTSRTIRVCPSSVQNSCECESTR